MNVKLRTISKVGEPDNKIIILEPSSEFEGEWLASLKNKTLTFELEFPFQYKFGGCLYSNGMIHIKEPSE